MKQLKKRQYKIVKKTICKSGRILVRLQEDTSYGYSNISFFEDTLQDKMLEKNFEIINMFTFKGVPQELSDITL